MDNERDKLKQEDICLMLAKLINDAENLTPSQWAEKYGDNGTLETVIANWHLAAVRRIVEPLIQWRNGQKQNYELAYTETLKNAGIE